MTEDHRNVSSPCSFRQENSISQLEQKFVELNDLLYATSVPCKELDSKAMPYIAEDIVFQDPWQIISSKGKYSVGMKGYHNMFNVTFDTHQVSAATKNGTSTGRCIVDGVINLQLAYFFNCPLRAVVVYDFRMLDTKHADDPKFEIFYHQEMWSYMEMVQAVPAVGWIYKNLFRPIFGHLFVAVSYLSCTVNDFFISTKRQEQEKRKQ